jgi:hypothetical protein
LKQNGFLRWAQKITLSIKPTLESMSGLWYQRRSGQISEHFAVVAELVDAQR